MDRYQTTKVWVCFRGLLPKILASLSQLHKIQTGGLPREILRVVKARAIRILNLGAEDFFVGRRRTKIYTM